jgi:hypothetical protein
MDFQFEAGGVYCKCVVDMASGFCGWQLEQKILSAGGSLPYPEEDY